MTGPSAVDPALLADYGALRSGVGARRIDRDVLRVAGSGALEYLEGQCSQALASVPVGSSVDSLLLQPEGKMVALVRVTRTGDEEFVVDVDGGFGELVQARLARFKLRSKFDVEPLAWACLAIRGAGVVGGAKDPSGGSDGHLRGSDGHSRGSDGHSDEPDFPSGEPLELPVSWNGWAGIDLLGPEPLTPPGGARWCGVAAWEACRIEAGVPQMGLELDERTIPAEAGLVQRAVSLSKGCYTGQELVARIDARGNKVARRLCAVVPVEGSPIEAERLAGAALHRADGTEGGAKELGRVTSAAWCPGVDGLAGLAFVHRSVEVGGVVDIVVAGDGGDDVNVFRADVRALPLV